MVLVPMDTKGRLRDRSGETGAREDSLLRCVRSRESTRVPSSLYVSVCLSVSHTPFPSSLPQLMCHRVTSRIAFGKPLADQGMIQHDLALSCIEIDQARLLCLNGNKAARDEIAAIKVIAPRMAKTVID
jgi:hypothetical protein